MRRPNYRMLIELRQMFPQRQSQKENERYTWYEIKAATLRCPRHDRALKGRLHMVRSLTPVPASIDALAECPELGCTYTVDIANDVVLRNAA